MMVDYAVALDAMLKDIASDKKLRVTKLADPRTLAHVDNWVSTQCLPLDYILGGGYPVRRIVEIYGDNSTGKSLLATGALAETQQMGGVSAYADVEIAQNPERMVKLGIDPEKLLYCNPSTMDDAFSYLDKFIAFKNKHFGKETLLTYVWDSVAASATADEIESASKDGYEARNYPSGARTISQAMRQIPAKVAENNVLFILINQTREKLGQLFGDGVSTYGGKAISFYSSVRIELESRAKIKDGKSIIGANVQVTIVKNRLSAPYKTLTLPLYYAYGMDEAEATFNFMLETGLIPHEKGSAWYTLTLNGTEQKFQKKDWLDIFANNYDHIIKLFKEL